jgi:ParB-like chromosome segregation protein Spo0J
MRTQVLENILKKDGWNFVYNEALPLKRLALTGRVLQQVRLDKKVDEDHVSRLVLALKVGAQFPALVVAADGADEYEIADGIHRATALQKFGRAAADAYVVTNAKEATQLDMLRRTLNAIPAKPLTSEEATQQAFAIYKRADGNLTFRQVAQMTYVHESSVSRLERAEKAGARLAKLVPGLGARMTTSNLDVLGQIRHDELLALVARIVAVTHMPVEETRAMAREAAAVVTDREADSLRRELEARFADELRKPVASEKVAIKDAPVAKLAGLVSRTKAIRTAWAKFSVRTLDAKNRSQACAFLEETAIELRAKARDRDGGHPAIRADQTAASAPGRTRRRSLRKS